MEFGMDVGQGLPDDAGVVAEQESAQRREGRDASDESVAARCGVADEAEA
jgi:hypothetical protein